MCHLKSIALLAGAVLVYVTLLPALSAEKPNFPSATVDFTRDRSRLEQVTAEFAASRPGLTLREVVAFANQQLLIHGLEFTLLLPEEAVPAERLEEIEGDGLGKSYRLTLPGKNTFTVSARTHSSCSGIYAFLPATDIDRSEMTLVRDRKTYSFPKPGYAHAYEAEIRDSSGERLLLRTIVPDEGVPFGSTPDGQSLLWQFRLGREAADWWDSVRARHPELRDSGSEPYLIVALSKDGFRFIDDPSLMVSEHGEVEGWKPLSFGDVPGNGLIESRGFKVVFPLPCS